MKLIVNNFPITNEEYKQLDKKFGQLCHFAAWELKKKNSNNNHTDDQEDISQDLKISLIRAGSYYKRQTYIEDIFEKLKDYLEDNFLKSILEELVDLWENRTRHGANRQKFGPFQEDILDKLLEMMPENERPNRFRSLLIDDKFENYAKRIIWNQQRAIGKKITREKSLRNGAVSLSEFDYLAFG